MRCSAVAIGRVDPTICKNIRCLFNLPNMQTEGDVRCFAQILGRVHPVAASQFRSIGGYQEHFGSTDCMIQA
jgi:hypothetical protein